MPAYKGTKELPKPSNKQARDMFTSMQKDREAMAKGRPDSVQRGEKGEVASMKKMKKGGMADKAGRALVKKSADTMGRAMVKKAGGGKCYASGGSVSSTSKRADGCATKGKTDTKMVKMALGGSLSDMGLRRAPVAAPKPQGMGANMMRRKKGGSC